MFLLTDDLFVTIARKDGKQFECEIENQLLRYSKEVSIALASTSTSLLLAPTVPAAAVSHLNGFENMMNEYLIDK